MPEPCQLDSWMAERIHLPLLHPVSASILLTEFCVRIKFYCIKPLRFGDLSVTTSSPTLSNTHIVTDVLNVLFHIVTSALSYLHLELGVSGTLATLHFKHLHFPVSLSEGFIWHHRSSPCTVATQKGGREPWPIEIEVGGYNASAFPPTCGALMKYVS